MAIQVYFLVEPAPKAMIHLQYLNIHILMITQEKFKLFSCDPKFRNINRFDKDASELAILKIYAGQKQTRKQHVIRDSIQKRNNPKSEQPNDSLDFLQSRIQAFQQKLISDIESFYEVKQSIKDGEQNRERIEAQLDDKLQKILNKIQQLQVVHQEREHRNIEKIEKFVVEIEKLHNANSKLAQQNRKLKKKIQEKQHKLELCKKS